MTDDTLTNILNLLQSNGGSNNNTTNNNNEIQNMLLKFLLSGGLNNLRASPPSEPEPSSKPRTIDLTNYKRLD